MELPVLPFGRNLICPYLRTAPPSILHARIPHPRHTVPTRRLLGSAVRDLDGGTRVARWDDESPPRDGPVGTHAVGVPHEKSNKPLSCCLLACRRMPRKGGSQRHAHAMPTPCEKSPAPDQSMGPWRRPPWQRWRGEEGGDDVVCCMRQQGCRVGWGGVSPPMLMAYHHPRIRIEVTTVRCWTYALAVPYDTRRCTVDVLRTVHTSSRSKAWDLNQNQVTTEYTYE